MKYIKSFNQLNEHVSQNLPINYNSGACSVHLNFNIYELSRDPFIYPGRQYTTTNGSRGLLEEFCEAIQKYDLTKIRSFFNGKQAFFDREETVVSCGGNNLDMIEIPLEISKFVEFHHGRYDENHLNDKQLELCKKITSLEEGKIYVCFNFRRLPNDISNGKGWEYYTGVIDVTEQVKEFIEKSYQLN